MSTSLRDQGLLYWLQVLLGATAPARATIEDVEPSDVWRAADAVLGTTAAPPSKKGLSWDCVAARLGTPAAGNAPGALSKLLGHGVGESCARRHEFISSIMSADPTLQGELRWVIEEQLSSAANPAVPAAMPPALRKRPHPGGDNEPSGPIHEELRKLREQHAAALEREAAAVMELKRLYSEKEKSEAREELAVLEIEGQLHAQHEEEMKKLKSELRKAEEEAQRLREASGELVALRDEVDCLRPLESKLSKSEAALDKCRRRLEDLCDLQEQLKKEEEAHSEVLDKCLALETEVAQIPQLRKQVEAGKRTKTELEFRVRELGAELEQARAAASSASSAVKDLADGSDAARAVSRRLQEELLERQQLESRRDEGGVGQGWSELNPELTEEMARLRRDNALLRQNADHNTAQRVTELEEQLDDAQRLADTYEEALSSTKRELVGALARIEEMTITLEHRDADLKDTRQENGRLSSQLEATKSSLDARTAAETSLRVERTALQSSVEALQSALDSERSAWKNQRAQMEEQHTVASESLRGALTEAWALEKATLQEFHLQEIAAKVSELTIAANVQREAREAQYAEEINAMQQLHAAALASMEATSHAEKAALGAGHAQDLDALKTLHAQELDNLQLAYEARIKQADVHQDELVAAFETEKAQLLEAHAASTQQAEARQEQLMATFEAEKANILEAYAASAQQGERQQNELIAAFESKEAQLLDTHANQMAEVMEEMSARIASSEEKVHALSGEHVRELEELALQMTEMKATSEMEKAQLIAQIDDIKAASEAEMTKLIAEQLDREEQSSAQLAESREKFEAEKATLLDAHSEEIEKLLQSFAEREKELVVEIERAREALEEGKADLLASHVDAMAALRATWDLEKESLLREHASYKLSSSNQQEEAAKGWNVEKDQLIAAKNELAGLHQAQLEKVMAEQRQAMQDCEVALSEVQSEFSQYRAGHSVPDVEHKATVSALKHTLQVELAKLAQMEEEIMDLESNKHRLNSEKQMLWTQCEELRRQKGGGGGVNDAAYRELLEQNQLLEDEIKELRRNGGAGTILSSGSGADKGGRDYSDVVMQYESTIQQLTGEKKDATFKYHYANKEKSELQQEMDLMRKENDKLVDEVQALKLVVERTKREKENNNPSEAASKREPSRVPSRVPAGSGSESYTEDEQTPECKQS
jgi:hypothetical protein